MCDILHKSQLSKMKSKHWGLLPFLLVYIKKKARLSLEYDVEEFLCVLVLFCF